VPVAHEGTGHHDPQQDCHACRVYVRRVIDSPDFPA
jgi:hypothetical protein